jgi:protein-tyrosine phosphatase
MSRQVLFLCTGNYYRSRFAELWFNHLAAERGLDWRAASRGLARNFGTWNVGPISPHALAAAARCQVRCDEAHRDPMHCYEDDLRQAGLVIALKEAEHRPLLQLYFPGWEDRVTYWHIHDVDQTQPADALAEIQRLVIELVDELDSSS